MCQPEKKNECLCLYLFSMFVLDWAKQQKMFHGVLRTSYGEMGVDWVGTYRICMFTNVYYGGWGFNPWMWTVWVVCAWCACQLLYVFPIIQIHAYRLTHALYCTLYRECSSVNHLQSLVIQLIRSTILCWYRKGTERTPRFWSVQKPTKTTTKNSLHLHKKEPKGRPNPIP